MLRADNIFSRRKLLRRPFRNCRKKESCVASHCCQVFHKPCSFSEPFPANPACQQNPGAMDDLLNVPISMLRFFLYSSFHTKRQDVREEKPVMQPVSLLYQ